MAIQRMTWLKQRCKTLWRKKHLVLRRPSAGRGLKISPTFYHRYGRQSVIGLLIVAMIAGILLPALQTRATSLTWSSAGDFGFNRPGVCGTTQLSNLTINSAEKYTDNTCGALGKDANLSLAKNPNSAGSLTGVRSVAAGGSHSLALLADGTVWAWGQNSNGQLGNGTLAQRETPTQVTNAVGDNNLVDITAIAAGSAHSLALKEDGTVWAWGQNNNGQLGNGTSAVSMKPVQVKDGFGGYLGNITAIAAGGSHSLALKTDGSIIAWGGNSSGQLGDDTTINRNIPVQVKNTDGGTLTGVKSIAAGTLHSLALKADGTALAWGDGGSGRLGDGATGNRKLPVQVKDTAGTGTLGDIASLVGGIAHTLALKSDGTVFAWGQNSNSQLGDNSTSNRSLPVQVKDIDGTAVLSGIKMISAGGSHSLALQGDGRVLAWGYANAGQLGDNSTSNRSLPVQVKDIDGTAVLSGIKMISAGGDGSSATSSHSLALGNDEVTFAWGGNGSGQLGDTTVTNRLLPISVREKNIASSLSDVRQIAAGSNYTVALKNDGTVWAWGYNNWGQLGNGTTADSVSPAKVVNSLKSDYLSGIVGVATNNSTTYALASDGTVWAWGYGSVGQIGNGLTSSANSTPVQVKDSSGSANLTGVIKIFAGGNAIFALKNDGTVWAWGANSSGQLGDGTTTQRNLPVQVKDSSGSANLTGVTSIAVGGSHATALKNDGTVWAWGANSSGQLGDGTTTQRNLPVQVKDSSGSANLTGVIEVSSFGSFTLALRDDSTVLAWGSNSGRLGDGATANRSLPVQVKNSLGTGNLTNITSLAASSDHSLALQNDGTVWAWGATNNNGQLGDGTTVNRSLPVQVRDSNGVGPLMDVKNIMASTYNGAVLKNDGTVWAWGSNTYGQLGDGTTIQRNVLVQTRAGVGSTGSLANIISVNGGQNHTVALRSDGTVWAWGYNAFGQLGDGTTTQRNLPVQVKDTAGTGVLTGVKQVISGTNHTVALKNDGTVWTWGYNGYSQLGDGTTTQRNLPVQVKDTAGTGVLTGVKDISAGEYHTVALKNDGTVWTWGTNSSGQLGDGTTTQRNLPVQVKDTAGTGVLTGVKQVISGNSHTLALKNDTTAVAWGSNSDGQLGGGSGVGSSRNLPIQVKDTTGTGALTAIESIMGGYSHTVALKNDGTVWTWGSNNSGQLGDGATSSRNLPAQVKNSSGTGSLVEVVRIATGFNHSLALKNDGTVWTWGTNSSGQLGDGTTTQRNLPVQARDTTGTGALTGMEDVAAGIGANHSLALKNDGTVWAWGSNSNGQTSGPFSRYILPIAVMGPTGAGAVYYPIGTLSGLIVDLGKGRKTQWQDINWKSQALAAGTVIGFKVRTSQDGNVWNEWSNEFTQTSLGSTTGSGNLTALPFSRYIEVQAILKTGSPSVTPVLEEFSVSHMNDTTPPSTNANDIVMKRSQSGSQINEGDWVNSPTSLFSWTAAEDNQNRSGIGGYCLYLGHDNTADLTQTKGMLGQSPIDTDGQCQYATPTTQFDLSANGALSSALTSSNDPYYFSVKAIDKSGNLFTGPAESFSFKYDVTPPKNIAFVSLPSQFIPTKDVTITWPTSGNQTASDDNSDIAGLQYRIGDNGTWYGAQHSGAQDVTDVLNISDGSYTTNPAHDYPLLNEGNNIVYFRAIDKAGNISGSLTSGVIKLNTSAPSEPKSLSVTPTTNTSNSFGFSWSPPQTFVGDKDKLSYCYTVNTLPSATTCTFTNPGQTSLPESSYATQPGANMFYLVARDEAGNINYATAASVSFTANTAAPGIPLNAEVADISIKATQNWKLALSWEKPASVGAGVARYQILRSTNSTSGFAQVATTSGTSYVDSGLDPVMYYYKIKACDSANHCGVETPAINKLPTGRFTTPPELIGAPTVRISARGATVNWTTDRDSDSRVQIGTESGKYRASETSNSDHTQTHELKVDGLEAGTTYYYKVRWADEDGNIGSSSEQSFTTLPAPVVKNVKVIKSTLSSATIQFTSVDATKVSLQYGKSENFGGIESVNTSVAESTYTVELDGLDDGVTYSFRPTAVDRDGFSYPGDTYTFSTPPRPRISNLRFQPIDGEPTSTQKVTWTTNVDTNSAVSFGKVGKGTKDILDSKMTKNHEVIVRDLEDDSDYFMVAQSRDAGGNLAVSDRQTFRTALDTRPPSISKINVETSIKGTGGEARGQVIVSWTTDEPATSQVSYGEGKSAAGYLNKTAESTTLTTEHVVIISDLAPSKVYYIQPISRDKADNATKGKDQAAIIGRASQNVLNIILDSLYKVFGVK